jgi:hypothetical protein
MKRGYDRREVADALMFPSLPRSLANTLSDPALDRATILPVGRRTFTDPGDDITEERSLEVALPGLLYDPLMGAARVSDMFAGAAPVDPDAVTQFMIDAPFAAGVLSAATGAAPKGAVLGANVLPSRFLDDVRPARENMRTVIDSNTIGGRVVGDETVPIGLLSGGASTSAKAQKAIDDIADSMSGPEGFIERLIVDQDNNVIEGAHRLEALRKLGVDEVPVTRIVDPQASFTGKNLMGMRAAIDDVGPVHSDNVNRIVSDIGDMLADPAVAGDPKKVAKVFDFPKGYEKHYQAALKSIELGANKAPTAALPGLLDDLPQYRTSDGYTFYQQKDGTLTDNADPEMSDMVFDSLDDLANDFGEMPLPVGKNEVAEKAATEFVEDFASFMDPSPERLPDDVKIQRALNTQRRKKDIDLAKVLMEDEP